MLLIAALIFLTVWGTLLLVRYTAETMLFSLKDNEDRILLAIPFSGSVVEAEYIIRTALRITSEKNCAFKILLVDCGVDEETGKICLKMADDYCNIVYLKAENLAEYMKEQAEIRFTE